MKTTGKDIIIYPGSFLHRRCDEAGENSSAAELFSVTGRDGWSANFFRYRPEAAEKKTEGLASGGIR